MRSLPELQRAMLTALLGGEAAPALAHLARTGGAGTLRPEQRLGIYVNTARSNFEGSLRSSFPVVLRLVGEDYFKQTARLFQRAHPSRSGDLGRLGAGFPDFLAQLHAADEHRYLADVARFEWLCEEALLSAEHPGLALEALHAVPPASYESLQFKPHPSLRLFESPFPVRRIWEANVAPQREPPIIDLAEGGERLALARIGMQLAFHALSGGEHAFLDALAHARPLGAAIERAAAEEAAFDAGAALRRFVSAGLIVDVELPHCVERTHSEGPSPSCPC